MQDSKFEIRRVLLIKHIRKLPCCRISRQRPPSCGNSLTNWSAQSDAQFSLPLFAFPVRNEKSRFFILKMLCWNDIPPCIFVGRFCYRLFIPIFSLSNIFSNEFLLLEFFFQLILFGNFFKNYNFISINRSLC